MKKLYTILSFLLLCSFPLLIQQAVAQKSTSMDPIVAAIKSGNASQLSKFFDAYVEVSLPEKSNSYSKSQAELVMKDFFSSNTVQNFEVKHRGENGGNQFCIGILQTKNGKFRTTIFLKQRGGKQLLQEIRVEATEA